MGENGAIEHIDTVVIGAGQAGLSAGYHLKQRGLPFAILDADARIGDHWRDRWDSLKLYSPARYDSLPGQRFPAPSSHWPTGREMGDYLEAYARWFELPVRSGTRVDRVEPVEDGFVVSTRGGQAHRRTPGRRRDAGRSASPTSRRSPPSSTRRSGSSTRTSTATRPSSRDGPVLVVGLSHSGADIAFEAANAGHRTILSGKSHGQMPIRVTDSKRAMLGWPVVEFVFGHVAHDAHADGPARCARRSARAAARSSGSACRTSTGPASSAMTRRPSASRTAGRCSPTAPSSTWPT